MTAECCRSASDALALQRPIAPAEVFNIPTPMDVLYVVGRALRLPSQDSAVIDRRYRKAPGATSDRQALMRIGIST